MMSGTARESQAATEGGQPGPARAIALPTLLSLTEPIGSPPTAPIPERARRA
jgi:hypothetical protein